MEYGQYLILRIVNHKRPGEMTNVGCAIFGADGKRLGFRTDPDGVDRAFRRGDISDHMRDNLKSSPNYLDNYLNNIEDIERVERAYGSTGHAMSCVQLGSLCATLIRQDVVDDIFTRYVMGDNSL